MRVFGVGFLAGLLFAGVRFGFAFTAANSRNKDKELIEYVERQVEIEVLREDYGSRDFVEFLDDVPGVRRAADGAAGEFGERVDEILQRFRNRFAD